MGVEVSSAFLHVLLKNLATLILEELRLVLGAEDELRNLRDSLSMIHAVLHDAEERQYTENAVRLWLNELRVVAYDANDVLDEFATEAQRRRLIPYARVRNSLSFLNPQRGLFWLNMSRKVKETADRLAVIGNRHHAFSLKMGDEARNQERRLENHQSTSLNPSSALGRESDSRRIIQLLVPLHGEVENNISVISILGMGGLGKTTLAQLVYND